MIYTRRSIEPYMITGNSDNSFHEVLCGIHRITKHNMSPRFTGRYGIIQSQTRSATVAEFVDQQVVADEQGVFHGFRWNLKCLHDETYDEHSDNDRHKKDCKDVVHSFAVRFSYDCHLGSATGGLSSGSVVPRSRVASRQVLE